MIARLAAALAVVLSIGIAGCARTAREPAPAPAANRDRIEALRQNFMQSNPNARVGVVTATRPDDRLAAVGDVNVAEFKEGEPIMFIDSDANPLVYGQVVRVTSDSVHVQYRQPASGRRAPQPGDLAVRGF